MIYFFITLKNEVTYYTKIVPKDHDKGNVI